MKTFKSIKATGNSNRIVQELNSSVLTSTFKSIKGEQLADLYSSRYTSNMLVAHGTCAPINSEFLKTVKITFN